MTTADDRPKSRILRFFGLETRDKALRTVLWLSPYLAFLVAALAGASFLVHLFMPLPVVAYAVAILLAVIYFFFFLARVRQMGVEAQERSKRPGAEPP